MFGDDVRGELFGKIGVENSSSNPLEMLIKAERELSADNALEAKKIFKELIEVTGTNANRFIGQSQHRAAAQEYFIQAVAYEHMEQTDERDSNYSKIIDSLLSFSKTSLQFDENERGITAAVLSGMVCIVSGNNNRATEIYNKNMVLVKDKPNSQTLVQLLYALGNLLDAQKNTSMKALTDAQNYISKDLTQMLAPSKLEGFSKLLQSAVMFVQNEIERKIKMPKVKMNTFIPKDILFNQVFEVIVDIENIGEGDAFDIKFDVIIPEGFEKLGGDAKQTYKLLPPNGKEKLKFSMRFQTAEELSEIVKEIKGSVSFNDMLGNGHKQYFGPLDIEIRAVSKTLEYHEKLKKSKSDYEAIKFGELDNMLQLLVPSMNKLFNQAADATSGKIDLHEFNNAEFGFEFLDTITKWQKSILFGTDMATSFVENVKTQIKDAEEKLTVDLSEKFGAEKASALEILTKEKGEEQEKAIQDFKTELDGSHQKEIKELKEIHFKELGNINQTHDNKLHKSIADMEQNLETKHVQNMNEKSDEFEKTLREFRTQHENELEEERSKIREDLKNKYLSEIDNLNQSTQEENRKLKDAHEAEIKNSLQTQKSKLEKEKNEELENANRNIEGDLNAKHEKAMGDLKISLNEQISNKQKLIDDLERQVRDLKSSSS